MQALCPEVRLLLACVTPAGAEQTAATYALCTRDINWARLLHLAAVHKMRPLLFHYLTQVVPDHVPTDVMDTLRQHAHANVARNLHLAQTLIRLVERLRQSGIEAIPFKGPVLAELAYGNIGLREFVDLDVLVDVQAAPRASHILQDDGWTPSTELMDWMIPLVAGQQQEFRKNGIALDLHWSVMPKRSFFAPSTFPERVSVLLVGQPIRTFRVEDHLLLLCLHGTKDAWDSLQIISGVGALLTRYPALDWNRLLQQAERYNVLKLLAFALFLAQETLGVPLPVPVQTHIASLRDRVKMASKVIARWSNPVQNASQYHVDHFLFEWWTLATLRDRLRYLFATTIPTPMDMRLIHLPRALRGLYYLLRPFRLAWDYGAGCVRVLFLRT